MDKTTIEDGLAGFNNGTNGYHKLGFLHGSMVCTDGVKWLAENAGCFWLLDLIASYQPRCRKDPRLREIQFWTFSKKGTKGKAVCERDAGEEAFHQNVPFTDFPLDEIKLWVEAGECGGKPVMVCMLPTER